MITDIGRLLLIIGFIWAEDSLLTALTAIDRRQRDLSDYSRNDEENVGEIGYPWDGSDDLAFLLPSDYNTEPDLEKNSVFERLLLDYLADDDSYLNHGTPLREDDDKKRRPSVFRKRLDEDKDRQLTRIAETLLASERSDNQDYNKMMREIWEKQQDYPYLYGHPQAYAQGNTRKRMYYPRWGLDSIGLRKKSMYYDGDSLGNSFDFYNDRPKKRLIEDGGYYDWDKNTHIRRDRMYNYPMRQLSVTKRSKSNFSDIIHEQKRSTFKKELAEKTDPKVVKDLSNVFGTTGVEKLTTVKQKDAKEKQSSLIGKKTKQKSETSTKKPKQGNTKEEITETGNAKKSIQLTKKSIDWSDYFGFDRRKKSSDDQLDNEWLMERYHKAIALASKRNPDYPLQIFKNHENPTKKTSDKKDSQGEDLKISEMDAKLKNMEETIIDDALKYTGAHEGTTDSQEIQEVKDRVISRLAAAYSLEKMRRALGEYKLSVAQERQRIKQQQPRITEDKRVAVPRKQAIDEDREEIPEGDNDIKCSQDDEDCEEQNYRTPSDILEEQVFEECPPVRQACMEVASVLNNYGKIIETACHLHQMCLLCSNNWFAPTRPCNALFLAKAAKLCEGKQECQKEARKSLRYLMEVNKSLRLESLGECELSCPDRR